MIDRGRLPENALLQEYAQSGAYTDCYVTEITGSYTHAAYVTAFYKTWLFRLERVILKFLAKTPSTDQQALDVAEGQLDTFAAWHVEKRADNQLLMCDFRGRTRSWFMSEPVICEPITREPFTREQSDATTSPTTRLYFGSAVVLDSKESADAKRIGLTFKLLLGFHKLYSRLLLAAAARRLRQ